MRGVLFLVCYLASHWGFSQDVFENNGVDIRNICLEEDCLYSALKNPIVYEEDGVEHWQMFNVELAIKDNGYYIVTGDLAISGAELAAKLNIKVLFYGDFDEFIIEVESGEFEFYSEPGHAEPFVFRGQLTEAMAKKITYLYFEVVSSEIVPYYDISSDCYLACKSHKLNEAKKAFRKSK